jgi:hypothetical protein
MRLSTARRKDPMHLYFNLLFNKRNLYIEIWEIFFLSTMENHLYFNFV